MKKELKTIILILLLTTAVLVAIFIYRSYFKEGIPPQPTEKPVERLIVYVDEKKLIENEDKFIYTSTLRPNFNIFVPEKIDTKSVSLRIDDSMNVLMDEFYGKTILDKKEKKIIFQPSYMFTPQEHRLLVQYKDSDGNLASMNFNFILIFQEKFDKPLEDSSVWIVPAGRSSAWFNVQDGGLEVRPRSIDGHSSLAFLYPFPDDVTVDFELIPAGNNVSLVFYFLDSKSFVIGSDSNSKIILLRKEETSLPGKSFELLSGHHYHVRIIRKNCTYQLFMKGLNEGVSPDPIVAFLDNDILIDYTSCAYKSDRIGFSLWQNSKGVLIDNIFITGFSNY